jgi:hypothetical protein
MTQCLLNIEDSLGLLIKYSSSDMLIELLPEDGCIVKVL